MKKDKEKFDWKPLIVILIILGVFTYVGVVWGIITLVIGVVSLGWSKRHDGPLPTNKNNEE